MLGIIRCLEAWRHYLEGAKEFEIWTDHKNLEYFMMAKKLNRRQAQWALFLSRFDFKLIHKAGTSMGKADALSWRPDHGKGIENDNTNVILVKPEMLQVKALQQGHVLIHADKQKLLERIKQAKSLDEPVIKAVEAMKKAGSKMLDGREWELEQDLVLNCGKQKTPTCAWT
jgi:hypothetical protein